MAEPQGLSERIFVRRVLIVLSLTALFILAWQLRTLILMIFGAFVVATIFRAFAGRLTKLGLREGIATAASIIVILGLALGLIALFGSYVGEQVQTLRETLPAAWKTIEVRLGDLGLGDQIKR